MPETVADLLDPPITDMPEGLSAPIAGRLQAVATTPTGSEPVSVTYRAWLVPEDFATDDGRYMAPGSLQPRLDRLPLMASDRNLPMHLQAEFIGNLVDFGRSSDADGTSWVTSAVDFDSDAAATEWQRMVNDDRIRGVSVDLVVVKARIKNEEGSILDAETGEAADDQSWPRDDSVWLVVDEALILGATMVPMPAFRDARVEPVAIAAAVEQLPPDWFALPHFDGPSRASVLPNGDLGGRLLGHGAAWGTCLVGHRNCIIPPNTSTDYALARRVPSSVGMLVPIYWQDGGDLYSHAPLDLPWWEAIEWYEQRTQRAGLAKIGDDVFGIGLAGYCGPQLAGRHLSGDWRPLDDGYELIGWSIVNKPGFPVPAAIAAAMTSHRAIVGSAEPDCGCDDKGSTVGEVLKGLVAAAETSEDLAGSVGMIELEATPLPDFDRLAGALEGLTLQLTELLSVGRLEYERYQAKQRATLDLAQLD